MKPRFQLKISYFSLQKCKKWRFLQTKVKINDFKINQKISHRWPQPYFSSTVHWVCQETKESGQVGFYIRCHAPCTDRQNIDF